MAPEGPGEGGHGGFYRQVRIAPEPGRVDVEVEDEFHHFGVTMVHDGVVVDHIDTREPRYPWTTCRFAGAHLSARAAGVTLAHAARIDDQRQHCTHLYDLFVLAAAHARDTSRTLYDIHVDDPVAGVKLAELDRDGKTLLRWRAGDASGRDGVPGGDARALSAWSSALPESLQEAARMLRRGVMVSGGRGVGFPTGRTAAKIFPQMSGACFSFQPDRAATALHMPDSQRVVPDLRRRPAP